MCAADLDCPAPPAGSGFVYVFATLIVQHANVQRTFSCSIFRPIDLKPHITTSQSVSLVPS